MIDLHCHILPDMDDGPSTIEESISMVQIAFQDGIKTITATPHCPVFKEIDNFISIRDEKIDTLTKILLDKKIEVNILRGAEIFIDMDIFDFKGIERLTLNGSRYILIELPMMTYPRYTEDFFYRLQLAGFIPIIAHPERNTAIMTKPDLLYRLIDLGSLAQINTGSITGLFGQAVQKCAKKLLTNKMAHIVATDAHSYRVRKPIMSDCIKVLKTWIGAKEIKKLVEVFPAAIIGNRELNDLDEAPCAVTKA